MHLLSIMFRIICLGKESDYEIMKTLKRVTKIGLTTMGYLIVCCYPIIAFAKKETAASKKETSYTYMNNILMFALVCAGFAVIFAIIKSGIKLSTAQDNPHNRTAGIIGLIFSFIGGYMVYKALDIAGYIHTIFGI